MSATTREFNLSRVNSPRMSSRPIPRTSEPPTLSAQWDAVQEAAAAVAILAQLGEEEMDDSMRSFPERAAAIGGSQLDLIVRGVDDMAAVMQPGLRALLALATQGRDTTSAALVLWREFHSARAAVLKLAPLE